MMGSKMQAGGRWGGGRSMGPQRQRGVEVARRGHGGAKGDGESRNSLMYIRKMTRCVGDISDTITGNTGDVPSQLACRSRQREQKTPRCCLPGTFGIQGASEHHGWVSSYGRRVASLV